MICDKCGNKNRSGSNFCRFCGNRLAEGAPEKTGAEKETGSDFSISAVKSKVFLVLRMAGNFKDKLSKKAIAIAIVIVLLSGTAAFAAPKVKDYFEVNKLIEAAKSLQNTGEYKNALASLISAEGKWTLQSKKEEINQLKGKEEQYIKNQELYSVALEKEQTGKLIEARELLQAINTDFPKYEEIKNKLAEIQSKIEGDLEAKAKAATAAKAEAERKAQAEAAAKARAQADAAAATEAKVRSDAAAAAAAEQARQAEYQRQQEATRRAEEVRKSFVNQLVTGYNSYNQGASYYSSAISYSNSGESILALAQANSARAVLDTARSSVSDLNSRFTGLSSDYYSAASNMVTAIDYLNKALNLLVASEGTYADYSSSINSNKDLSLIYANRVKSFLDSH